MVDIVSGDDILDAFDEPQRPFADVVRDMAQTVVSYDPEAFVEEHTPPSIGSVFDQGARLNLPDAPADPVPGDVSTATPKKRRKIEAKADRVAGGQLMADLAITGLITLVTFTVGEWALPNDEEAQAIAKPLGNILARRIDLATKLGKDANDAVALVIGLTTYLVRVGPIAAERARVAIADRRARERVIRVPDSGGSAYPESSSGVAFGSFADQGTPVGTARHTVDALAAARAHALRPIGGDA